MIAIISVLIGLVLPAVQNAREAARRSDCLNNCYSLATALHTYESQHGEFPIGAAAHRQQNVVSIGWTVLLLPQLEQQELYDRINPDADGGAGDEGHGMAVYAVPTYHCPSDDPPRVDLVTKLSGNYAGVSGAGRVDHALDLEDASCGDLFTDGLLTYQSPTAASDVTDGLSRTLAIGERVYWLEEWTFGAKWRGDPIERICVGAVKNLRYPVNANLQRVGHYVRDFSVDAAQRGMVRNDLVFGSHHPGGANFALADGSGRFINDSIDFTVLEDLATRNGGE